MKKKILFSALMLLTLVIAACATKSAGDKETAYSPSEAVESFYMNAKNGDLDEAKKYVSSEVINFYENNPNTIAGTLSYAMIDEGKRYAKVEAKNHKINGQTAIVTTTITGKADDIFEKDYNLIREEDGWKLLFQ